MYDKKLKLREIEPETIYISKAERYELIALLAKSVQEYDTPNQVSKQTKTTTH